MSLSAGQLSVGILYFLILNITSDGAWSNAISGLVPTVFLSPLMYLLAWRQGWHQFNAVRGTSFLGVAMIGFCVFALLSAMLNPLPREGWLPVIGGYVMPVGLFYAVSVMQLTEAQIRRCVVLLAIGSAIPMILGAFEFIREYGIPTGVDLLESRYDIFRMQGYMDETFGNTSNMAAYLAIVMPTLGAALITYWARRGVRLVLLITLFSAFVNVLIVQSRTLYIVLTLIFPLIALFYRLRFGAIFFVLISVVAAIVIPVLSAVDQFVQNTVGVAAGVNEDNSVSERLDAMRAALRIVKDHFAFGVGPGNSLNVNPFTSAHEYILQQGSEIGAIGILLAALLTIAYAARGFALFKSRSRDTYSKFRFAMLIGPIGYYAYGLIGNVPLSQTIVVTWIGSVSLFAGASFIRIERTHMETKHDGP
jgi:hypothetical protein